MGITLPVFCQFADGEVSRYRNLRRHSVPILCNEGRTALDEKKPLIGAGGAVALAKTIIVCRNSQLFGQEADDIASIQDQMTRPLVQLWPIGRVGRRSRVIEALDYRMRD